MERLLKRFPVSDSFSPKVPVSICDLLEINDGESDMLYGDMMLGFCLMPVSQILEFQKGWNEIAICMDEDEKTR